MKAGAGTRKASLGLSMMEVLAAMVIFSSSAVVLFGWVSQTSQRMVKLETEQQQLFAELAALDFLRSLNPMQQPDGETPLQRELQLSWHSTPIGSPEPVRASPSTPGIYQVQLYKVEYRIAKAGGDPILQSVFLAGWKQTSEVKRELPFPVQ